MIDAHVHVWTLEPATYPWQQTLRSVPVPMKPATAEMLLKEMDAAGTDRAVLVQPSIYGWDNSYLCNALDRFPERFAGVCLVDPRSPTAGDDLHYWCAERGCSGVRINLIEEPDPNYVLESARDPLWHMARQLRTSVSLQIRPEQAATVLGLAERFGDVAFVVDYLGPEAPHDGSGATALAELAEAPNVYCKLLVLGQDSIQEFPFRDLWPFHEAAVRSFGPKRLVFGTDFPHVLNACNYSEATSLLHCLPFIDPAEVRQIAAQTAAELWMFHQN